MPITFAVHPTRALVGGKSPDPARSRRRGFSPPVEQALKTLQGRADVDGRGGFSLDGRPAPLRAIIREANRLRALRGNQSILYPGAQSSKGRGQ
jgi:hypothetical protein